MDAQNLNPPRVPLILYFWKIILRQAKIEEWLDCFRHDATVNLRHPYVVTGGLVFAFFYFIFLFFFIFYFSESDQSIGCTTNKTYL